MVESGQTLLLVLLGMAVILTIVLSIVSRSITDITVSTKEEEALRAFSAAEAGVERALLTGANVAGPIGDASFTANVTGAASPTKDFPHPIGIISGESLIIWFVNHDSNGSSTCTGNSCFTGDKFKLCWGKSGTSAGSSTTPAVEVSVFYAATPGDYSTTKIARDAIDPNSTRRSTNSFSAPDAGGCQIGSSSYAFQKTINLGTGGLGIPAGSYNSQNGLQFARIRMLYNTDISHELGVSTSGFSGTGNFLFPPQGSNIVSTGVAGASNRKVEVFQGYGEPPPIFDAAIFSPSGITK